MCTARSAVLKLFSNRFDAQVLQVKGDARASPAVRRYRNKTAAVLVTPDTGTSVPAMCCVSTPRAGGPPAKRTKRIGG